MNHSFHHEPETALGRLFVGPAKSPDAAWFSLPGGKTLIQAGEPADSLYYLKAGRLGAVRHDAGEEPQFLGLIRPGEPAGEMAMVAGTPHTATVVALRDSEIVSIPREAFFRAVHDDPEVMSELAHLMILRARHSAGASLGDPVAFGFMGIGEDVAVRPLVEAIEDTIAALGYAVTTVGAEAASAPTEWFSNVEATHDIVLYPAEATDEELRVVTAVESYELPWSRLGAARPGAVVLRVKDTLTKRRLLIPRQLFPDDWLPRIGGAPDGR